MSNNKPFRKSNSGESRNLYEELRLFPFVRLAIALLGGIAWQASAWVIAFPAAIVAVGLAVVYIVLLFVPYLKTYTRQWIPGTVALLCIFFTGAALMQRQPTNTSLPLDEKVWLQAEVCDMPLVTDNYTKLLVVVKKYATASDTVSASEKIILYVRGLDVETAPVAGSTIYAHASLSTLPPPRNPEEFNYQQFLARRKIFTSAFVPTGDYLIDTHRSFWQRLRYQPLQWQQNALQVFADSPLGEREFAVIAALTLGVKQYLDDDIRTSYQVSGAMHILAVSGLHVGIIMAILMLVFSFLAKRKHGLVWRNTLIIACLWMYAAVVGFSPSVTRAVVMFSFVLLGGMMQRKLSVYNSLAASAFVICLFNPQVLFEAGFQLSYGAVLGIVYFQPKMYSLLYVKNKFLDGIWQLATVSVAAQIGTIPLSLFYFHLFPNYFLLTNICIITLTGWIVYGGALYLLVHSIPGVSTVVGSLLHALLWVLNHIVQFIESLPYAATQNIYLSGWQMALLIAIILCVAVYLYAPRRIWLWAAAYCVVGVVGGWAWQHAAQREQKLVAVYNVRNTSYIQFVNGRRSFTLSDKADSGNSFSFNVANFQIKQGIASGVNLSAMNAANRDTVISGGYCYRGFVFFNHQLYKILTDETIDNRLPAMPTDYLLVTGAARMKPELALQRYIPAKIILDSSVPVYRARQWLAAATDKGIDVHNVREEGAFIN